MKLPRLILAASIPALAVAAAALLAAGPWRSVDGRSASAWLSFSGENARSVTYHAEGRTWAGGKDASFVLDQGRGGRYYLHVSDDKGKGCSLGFDGDQVWYRSGRQLARAYSDDGRGDPLAVKARITGTGSTAGRRAIFLKARSGGVVKELSLDRETGTVLAMVTRFGDRAVSRMSLERIEYRPVEAAPGTCAKPVLRRVRTEELERILGRRPAFPTRLPAGLSFRGAYIQDCDCCDREMAALRFSDGVRSLTLFELPGTLTCAMKEGCGVAPDGSALVDSRRLGRLTVIAVGNVEQSVLAETLAGLV